MTSVVSCDFSGRWSNFLAYGCTWKSFLPFTVCGMISIDILSFISDVGNFYPLTYSFSFFHIILLMYLFFVNSTVIVPLSLLFVLLSLLFFFLLIASDINYSTSFYFLWQMIYFYSFKIWAFISFSLITALILFHKFRYIEILT